MQNNNPRITTGIYKGRKLQVPNDARPVTDRVKKTIFDILGDISGMEVLDLFAGSGNLGIEALSRGAGRAVFIDRSQGAIETIGNNLKKLGINSDVEVIKNDVFSLSKLDIGHFDLVLIDPPFKIGENFDLKYLQNFLKKNAILVLKLPSTVKGFTPPDFLKLQDARKMGVNTVYFLIH